MRRIIAYLFIIGLFWCTGPLSAQQNKTRAFNFELKDTLGRIVRLDDFKGKALVMDFWFTGCKGCVQVAEGLEKYVFPEFKGDSNVVFIAVSIDVNFLRWKKSIREGKYTSPEELNLFTMGKGGDHPLFTHYGFSGCPQMLIIDHEGFLVSKSPPFPGQELVSMIRLASRKQEVRAINGSLIPDGDIARANYAYLSYNMGDSVKTDSTEIKNNQFGFIIPGQTNKDKGTLSIGYAHLDESANLMRRFSDTRTFYFDADSITIKITNLVKMASIKGGESNKQFSEYIALTQPVVDIRDSLRKVRSKMDSVEWAASMKKHRVELYKREKQFVKTHPSFHFSLEIFNNLVRDYLTRQWDPGQGEAELREFQQLYEQFDEGLKKEGAYIAEQLKRSLERSIIPFEGEMPDGKTFHSNSLKGKVFLIDFWGSWCVWCRKGHPHLKELYAKYKKDGFEIIGIGHEYSKDRQEQWQTFREAIKKDGIEWPQLLNDPSKKNLVDTYLVTAFPTKILVDRNGKILLRVTDDAERKIDKSLKKIFGY